MKFITLLKKELRESLGLMILVLLIYGVLAGFMIRAFVHDGGDDYPYYWENVQNDHYSAFYGLFHRHPVGELGAFLLLASLGLGVGLGVLHFWVPRLTRTWPFLLHRSMFRTAILGSKLAVAALAFGAVLGVPWICAYVTLNHVKATDFPLNSQVLWEGWLFIGLGLILYTGIAQCSMSRARWYTTRLFGLVFAIFVLCGVFSQSSLSAAFTLLLMGLVILLVPLAALFSYQEF